MTRFHKLLYFSLGVSNVDDIQDELDGMLFGEDEDKFRSELDVDGLPKFTPR